VQAAPPSTLDRDGRAAFGTYRGTVPSIALPAGGLLTRLTKHKKWIYTFCATREVIALYAIADLTYTSNAFVVVVDRAERRVLVDRTRLGLPPPFTKVNERPAEGLAASFRLPGRIAYQAAWPAGGTTVTQSVCEASLRWDGSLDTSGGAPALTVIAPVSDGGVVNVTQKWAALPTRGTLHAVGRAFDLAGGVGGMDYTNGYLARHTAWRWAFACGTLEDGRRIGLNLVEGFNEANQDVNENALWLGDELIPLGRARFEWNKNDPLQPWRVKTVDGAIDLGFSPIGAHREHRDYRIVKSHFVQPVGHFDGTIKAQGRTLAIRELAGVTEDQDILW
jgi:hypothetical protein